MKKLPSGVASSYIDGKPMVNRYRHDKGSFVLVPIAFDEFGHGWSIDRIQLMESTCADEEFGRTIRTATQWTKIELFDPANRLPEKKATRAKSWRQFVRYHNQVSIRFTLEETIRVLPMFRDLRGGYAWRTAFETRLASSASDAELGAAVKAAFAHCVNELLR